MKIAQKLENSVIKHARRYEIFCFFFILIGVVNVLVLINQLYLVNVNEWYRKLYTSLLWLFAFQVYMGVIAKVALSIIRKMRTDKK
jgi:hypothetical protein